MKHRHSSKAQHSGFTVIELLVTISIIALLATLLVPALAGAKERGQRASCAGNIRQFILAAQLYAHDNSDLLPRPETACTALIKKTVLTNFISYAGDLRVLDCPNLHSRFGESSPSARNGWREQGPNAAIGYHYLGGHKGTPWPTNSSHRANIWPSPQRFSVSPADDLVADLNTSYEQMTVAPHGKRRPVVLDEEYFKSRNARGLIFPTTIGSAGGNVGSIAGAVSWRDMKRMSLHPGSFEWGGPFLGWW